LDGNDDGVFMEGILAVLVLAIIEDSALAAPGYIGKVLALIEEEDSALAAPGYIGTSW
jgi:hypothetical protein